MLLDDIGDYLTSGGAGTSGTNLFLSVLPESPDTCIGVFETGGYEPIHTMRGNPPAALRPTFQVVCRSKQYSVARLLAEKADKLLNGLRNRTINGIHYHWIQAQQSPFFISQDENQREEIGCNYMVIRESTTT